MRYTTTRKKPAGRITVKDERDKVCATFYWNEAGEEGFRLFVRGLLSVPGNTIFDFDVNQFIVGAKMALPAAWAVVDGGEINLRSVYPTRLGAIRNWLCTDGNFTLSSVSDDADAELAWSYLKRQGVEAKQVSVEVLP